MEKMGKPALVILVVVLTVFFVASHIMYGKLNENILIQIVEQQSLENNRLMNRVFAMQRELDKTEKELDSANKKIIALTTPAPAAAIK